MRVLGVEGTAWAASAALYDTEIADVPGSRSGSRQTSSGGIFIESDPYQPESGGIHPREAAEHMSDAVPAVIGTVLDHAAETGGAGIDVDESSRSRPPTRSDASGDVDEETSSGQRAPPVDVRESFDSRAKQDSTSPVDAVAFSRGPGLGPCLRIVATAARALAQSLDVPLIGVNHMVAHLEIGRHFSGFDSPVCLNASGANAHVLGFHDGRYRVLGETMDTGVGNAIDKFTRHVGWSHPGGPKVEEAARGGEYIDLPYVVKGMDFSFSGIMSAAKQAYDGGERIEDVCFSLQENVFAMLTEVAERALSLTGSDELVLGGGVGQNARLRAMLDEMCEARGAEFYAPDARFLRDNAGMIAVLGAKMLDAGDTVAVEDSRVDPNFRPDEVAVTWREGESVAVRHRDEGVVRGAEATVEIGERVTKRRVPKPFRHPELDARLRRERTVLEAKLTSEARRAGVPTPVIRDVDLAEATVVFERVGTADLYESFAPDAVRAVARHLAAIHEAGFVHGDPTARNVRYDERTGRTFLIDFGLGYHTDDPEDYAMDLHVFAGSLAGTADDPAALRGAFEDAYAKRGDESVLSHLRAVEDRGRYR